MVRVLLVGMVGWWREVVENGKSPIRGMEVGGERW